MKNDRSRLFAYIETRLYWGEGFTATMLGEAFGLARQNAQKVVNTYRKLFPYNIQYDMRKKKQIAGNNFQPKCIHKGAKQYLDYLEGVDAITHYWEASDWNEVPFENINRQIGTQQDRAIIRPLLSAIDQRKVVSIYYQSKYSIMLREISPHHLVSAGRRYHVRAYCHTIHQYLDFVLTRIREIETTETDWVSHDADTEWNTPTNLYFEINPELDEYVRKTLQLDYSLGDTTLYQLRTRQANAEYVRRVMGQMDREQDIPLWLEQTSE